MLIGYARVSTLEQNLQMQEDALSKAGCEKIYTEKISAIKDKRPALEQALSHLRSGDTFVVWRLDRLGRSLRSLIDLILHLKDQGIAFRSLQDAIDTSSAIGQFFFHVTGAFAELERNLIQERTKAGLDAARARGRLGGRPHKLNAKQISMMRELYNARSTPIDTICSQFNISKNTLYRYL